MKNQGLFDRMNLSYQGMIACGDDDFTLNLSPNASTKTVPWIKLSSFATLSATPMTFSGNWQVALLELARPTFVCKVTEKKNLFQKMCQALNGDCNQ